MVDLSIATLVYQRVHTVKTMTIDAPKEIFNESIPKDSPILSLDACAKFPQALKAREPLGLWRYEAWEMTMNTWDSGLI